jgi:hypothetical protein
VKTYQRYFKVAGRWQWVSDIRATSHSEALRHAMSRLKPEHYDKPIRVEPADISADARNAES